MKKILFSLLLALFTTALLANESVDERVTKIFKQTFPYAQKVKWIEYDDFYEVLFENNRIMCRIKYERDGKVLSLRRDYHGKDLPLFIQAKIQEKYHDKKVYGVTEITSEEGTNFHIILHDANKWYFVHSNGSGNLSLTKKLKKA